MSGFREGVGLQAWYSDLPPVTRGHLTLLVTTTVLSNLGLVRPENLHLTAGHVLSRWQLWRLGTTFAFVGGIGVSFVFYLHTLFFMGVTLERGSAHSWRNQRTANNKGSGVYAWYTMLACPLIIALSFASQTDVPFLSFSLYTSVMYFYSRLHPDDDILLAGLMPIKSKNLVWWTLLFQVVVGQPVEGCLVGLASALLLYHFTSVTSHPPEWLNELFVDDPVDKKEGTFATAGGQ
ncbi:Derlin-1 [Diplonema papillatum]|nr:Derlin-1 [Diplonema papillatum]